MEEWDRKMRTKKEKISKKKFEKYLLQNVSLTAISMIFGVSNTTLQSWVRDNYGMSFLQVKRGFIDG